MNHTLDGSPVVTFELTRREVRGATLRYILTQPLLVLLPVLIPAFILYAVVQGVSRGLLLSILPDIVILMLLELAFFMAVPRLVAWWYGRRWGGFNMTVSFSDEGIKTTTPSKASHCKWSEYTRARRVGEYYELRQDIRRFAVVPQRAFKDPARQGAFEALLQRHLKFNPER
jgi:hypothetical protein